jgi:O-antigen/teichoic acid export membrane protein
MLKKIGTLVITDVTLKIVSYLLLPIYLGLMPQEDFGEFSFIVSFISPLFVIVSFSLYVPFIRNFCAENQKRRDTLVSSIFNAVFIWLILIDIILYIFKPILKNQYIDLFHITNHSDEKYYLVILLLNTGILLLYCYSLLICRKNTKEIVVFIVLKFTLISCISLAFIYFEILGDESVLNRLFGIFLAEMFIALIYIFVYVKPYLSLRIDLLALRAQLTVALPLVLLSVISLFIVMIDRSLIADYHGMKVLASYNLAMIALSPIQMIMTSVQVAWAPHLFSLKNIDDAMNQTMKVMGIAFFVMVIGSALLAMAIYIAIYFKFIVAEYRHVPMIIIYASIGVIASALRHLNSNMFVHLNRTTYQLIIGLIVLSINWAMNILLIPKYSLYGAAISAGLANTIGLLIGLLLLRRIVNYRIA